MDTYETTLVRRIAKFLAMSRALRVHFCIGLLMSALALLFAPEHAWAHGGGESGPTQTFTQDIGPYPTTVILEMPPTAPAQLHIAIRPPSSDNTLSFTLRVVPRGQPITDQLTAQVQTLPELPGMTYYTDLLVSQVGAWELDVRANGPAGSGVARIPITITDAPLPPYSVPLLVALGALVLLLVTSITISASCQRSHRPVPRWLNALLVQCMLICVTASMIFGVQQMTATASSRLLNTPSAPDLLGRPHINVALSTLPAQPQDGAPLTLTLELTDGGTGLPVEDLTPHHEALVHLVILSEDNGFLAHVHPARAAPGRYTVGLTPDRPGNYRAYLEVAREASGTQVVTADFTVGGAVDVGAPEQTLGIGTHTIGDLKVQVKANRTTLMANQQATITFAFSRAGAPVLDLEPWLGMAGHLIIRDDNRTLFSHVHAAEPMAPGGVVGSGIRYGPAIRFAYSFPKPGRYYLWAQFQHQGQIVTVPLTVTVNS